MKGIGEPSTPDDDEDIRKGMEEEASRERDRSQDDAEEGLPEEGRPQARPSRTKSKTTRQTRKKKQGAPGKKVQWDDVVEDGLDQGGDEVESSAGASKSHRKGQGTGAKGTKKQSAEDRDLLAVVNSPRFRVNSPRRVRTSSSKAEGHKRG